MKMIINGLVLTLLTAMTAQASTLPCTQVEAQFIGIIAKTTESVTKKSCAVQIKFSSFDSSATCPLDIEEVIDEDIMTSKCDLKVGESVSGILIYDGKKTFIED